MPSRSNEKERSELKGGFRGIVYMKWWFTTAILRVKKKAFSEEKALSYAMSYIEDYFDM